MLREWGQVLDLSRPVAARATRKAKKVASVPVLRVVGCSHCGVGQVRRAFCCRGQLDDDLWVAAPSARGL